jgi:hypothetical protein
MNRILAEGVRLLNGFIAFLLVAFGALAGALGAETSGGSGVRVILGAILGFLVAIVVCGILATFIEIRSELVAIRQALARDDAGTK